MLAWLATIANVAGVDLSEAVMRVRRGLPRLRTIRLHLSRCGKTMMTSGNRKLKIEECKLRIEGYKLGTDGCRLQAGKSKFAISDFKFQIFRFSSFPALSYPGRLRPRDEAAAVRRRAGGHRDRYKAGLWTQVEVTLLGGKLNASRRCVDYCARQRRCAGACHQAVPASSGPLDGRSAHHPLRPSRRDLRAEFCVGGRVVASRTFKAALQADDEHFTRRWNCKS